MPERGLQGPETIAKPDLGVDNQPEFGIFYWLSQGQTTIGYPLISNITADDPLEKSELEPETTYPTYMIQLPDSVKMATYYKTCKECGCEHDVPQEQPLCKGCLKLWELINYRSFKYPEAEKPVAEIMPFDENGLVGIELRYRDTRITDVVRPRPEFKKLLYEIADKLNHPMLVYKIVDDNKEPIAEVKTSTGGSVSTLYYNGSPVYSAHTKEYVCRLKNIADGINSISLKCEVGNDNQELIDGLEWASAVLGDLYNREPQCTTSCALKAVDQTINKLKGKY